MFSAVRRQLVIVVNPGFSLLAFSSLISPLRIVNGLLGYQAYHWTTVSLDGSFTRSSCGVEISVDLELERAKATYQLDASSFIAVLTNETTAAERSALIPWVRGAIAKGVSVAGVGLGAFALAEGGLLDGRRCAISRPLLASAAERYPRLIPSRVFFEADGPIHTCAGEATAYDLMLNLVSSDHGQEVADAVNEIALQGKKRELSERQTTAIQIRLERIGSALAKVVPLMEDSIEEPLTIERLVARSGVSRRQMERLFHDQLGMSPFKFYCRLRIDRASVLLTTTNMPIVEVACASGFASASHFAKTYKRIMGCTPQQSRFGDHQALTRVVPIALTTQKLRATAESALVP